MPRIWAALVPACLAACGAQADEGWVLQDVVLVSPERGAPLAGQSVWIRDGRIAAILTSEAELPSGVEIVDGEGRYLTPGLMDSHHHVSLIPGMGPAGIAVAADNPGLVDLYMDQQPRSLLYHGVTQILDPSPLNAWRDFEASEVRPDLFRCGEIPTPGGYPGNQQAEGAEAGLHSYELDPEQAGAAGALVDRMVADGAICVKLYIEDGFGAANGWPVFDPETLAEIREAAHARNLPVLAHANAIDMYQIALDAELDVLAHGLWNWNWPEGEPPVVETLDRVAASQTGYMPTLMVMRGISDQLRPGSLDDPDLVPVVPSALMDFYRAGGSDFFTEELASDFPPAMPREEMAEIMGFAIRRDQQATAYLHQAGHPLLLASDCPGSPNHANQPGLCTYREMVMMADAGVSLPAILEAGTINNARRFGLDADYGTIEPGKIANLLLLDSNPPEDVTAWNRIDTVILHGEAHERDSFRATTD